jgi:hypothetical protein
MKGSTERVTFTGPNRLGLDLCPEIVGPDLLEESGVEVTRIVDQHIYAAEAVDRSLHRCLSVLRTSYVELNDQQIVRIADCLSY